MRRDLTTLSSQTFDLLIIGGGIFGAGVARDAAMRGLSVALLDQADFASGTSSRSSKLIHGGFRYLEQRAFGLVAEGSRERKVLLRIAPHLVKPLPFLFPIYEGDSRSLPLVRMGMTLYDLLARFGNTAPHRPLGIQATLRREPGLATAGLRGSVRYFDAQEDDARLVIDNLMAAAEAGATLANYCEVTALHAAGARIETISATDRLTGQSLHVRARAMVNAAGPWVERIAGMTPLDGPAVRLRPTKGVHLLVPRLSREHAIAFQARRDGRVMFVLPWLDCTLIGTTDTDYAGDPAAARAEPSDIEYLLGEANALFPQAKLTPDDVIATFAGIRPLAADEVDVPASIAGSAGGTPAPQSPSSRSRDHQILRRGENLLSITGGKYTTYRLIAEQATDAAFDLLGHRRPPKCRTDVTPLPLHRPPPQGARIAEHPDLHESDIRYAVEAEMAQSVEDVMRRRTPLALSRHGGRDVAERVAVLMTPLLGWDEQKQGESISRYLAGR